MAGKRYLTVMLIILTLMVSSCGEAPEVKPGPEQNATPVNAVQNTPGAINPPDNITVTPEGPTEQIIPQEEKTLPNASFLSSFPGVLKSMSLTLEELISILGNKFELYENNIQGYDVYQFPDYKLVFEYDKINEKLSTIWFNDIPYYVYSGSIKSFDIDNDGNNEEVAAYEDENFNGRVTVFSKDGVIKADHTTDYFDGKCEMSFISGYGPDKENLIILDTRAERDCEVFSYSNGKLISMLPPDHDNISEKASINISDGNVSITLADKGISYDCIIPGYLWNAYLNDTGVLQDYRFAMNVRPVISDNSLSLMIRHSLQLKFYEDPVMEEGLGVYIDVAQVINEYKYLGGGKWQFLSSKGGPKYDKGTMKEGITFEDFKVGSISLLAPIQDVAGSINLDLSEYSEYDLLSGVLIKNENLCIGISNMLVSYISLEKNSDKETARGLKISDTKQQALSLYGLPDKGYFEDSVWTYYILREENNEEGGYTLVDSFNIEFEGDIVSKIWMVMYVPVY